MNGPLVSIVIPAYNAANYLAQAIDSALAQSYENIEIIVVNDGSTDGGATRATALAYGDRIRYFEKENGGCASALNDGIARMRGEYFSWLSHDDLYLPGKISALLTLPERYGLDPRRSVLGCNDMLLLPGGRTMRNPFRNSTGVLPPLRAFGETLNKKTINGCGLLIPRTILEEAGGFRTDYRHLLDREMWMRIAAAGYDYCFVKDALVLSRVHGGQITVRQQDSLRAEEEKLILEYQYHLRGRADFLRELCCFACKRKHREPCRELREMLREMGALDAASRARILRYGLEGRAKRLVGGAYKRIIRRETWF